MIGDAIGKLRTSEVLLTSLHMPDYVDEGLLSPR